MYNDIDANILLNAPRVVSLHLGVHTQDFLKATGFLVNSQEHHEITRQCFDFVSNNFRNYIQSISRMPNFKMLLNEYLYLDSDGNITEKGKAVKYATLQYAMGIYFMCVSNGITINGSNVPYILHAVHNDCCILTFAL